MRRFSLVRNTIKIKKWEKKKKKKKNKEVGEPVTWHVFKIPQISTVHYML